MVPDSFRRLTFYRHPPRFEVSRNQGDPHEYTTLLQEFTVLFGGQMRHLHQAATPRSFMSATSRVE